MRRQANRVVMLRRAEPERAGTDLFQNFYKGRHARIFLARRLANKRVGIAAEQVGVSVGDAREFAARHGMAAQENRDRKSTRLNSSHGYISYAVFCLKKKNKFSWRNALSQCITLSRHTNRGYARPYYTNYCPFLNFKAHRCDSNVFVHCPFDRRLHSA